MRKIAISTIFFLSLFCAPINSLTLWGGGIIIPILLFGLKRDSIKKNDAIDRAIKTYWVLAILTILSGFLLFEFYRPLKGAALMSCCCISGWCVINRIKTVENFKLVLDGLVIASIIFTIILFAKIWNGGMVFSYEDDDSWLAKNVVSIDLYIGLIASSINFKLTKNKIYLGVILLLSIVVVMTTSLKVILSVIFILFVIILDLNSRERFLLLAIIIALIFWFREKLLLFFTYDEGQIIINRIFTFLGMKKYTTMHLSFVDTREDLMLSALNVFYEHPFGVGLENTRLFMSTYSHNTYIELLCGGSIVLLGVFVFFTVNIAKIIFKMRKGNNLFIISIAFFVSILFIGNAMRIYDNVIVIVMLLLIAHGNILNKQRI